MNRRPSKLSSPLLLLLLIAASGSAQEDAAFRENENFFPLDSNKATIDTVSSAWSVSEVFLSQTRPFITSAIAWPFEKLIQPLFGTLLRPLEPPLEYFFDNDVPERALDLFSFGRERNIVIYPFLGLSSGTGTVYGVGYRHDSPSRPNRYNIELSYEQSVSLDQVFRGEVSYLLPGDFATATVAGSDRNVRYRTYYLPRGGDALFYSDSSYYAEFNLNFKLHPRLSFSMGAEQEWNRWETSSDVIYTALDDPYDKNEFDQMVDELRAQGIFSNYNSQVYRAALHYNSLQSRYAPTNGSRWQLGAKWGVPEGHTPYLTLQSRLLRAHLLGKRPYEMTREENRKKQRYLRNFSFEDASEFFKRDQFRRLYLERKVLVNHLTWERVFALDTGAIPLMALPSLGKGSPLRGYDYRRFSDRAALLWSMEYRWPLLMRVDGVFFNEYGYYYPGEENFLDGRLRNSWGFGVRVRNPNFYFFRVQFAFHGTEGISMLMTVRPEF